MKSADKTQGTNRVTFKGVHKHPKKKYYRARAHSNPLNDARFPIPAHPTEYDWSAHYPSFFTDAHDENGTMQPRVEFADVGCGFGGLLVRLAPIYPTKLMLGMEIRDKVSNFVRERIGALRREHGGIAYGNISVMRTNAQKYLPSFFCKAQLTKLFFLFPDPHFKGANHRRRIIQTSLLAEYAYCLAPGGLLYTITDVEELGDWMKAKLDAHPLFERISEEELAQDPAANLLTLATEEGKKVARNSGLTWRNVYRRIASTFDVAS